MSTVAQSITLPRLSRERNFAIPQRLPVRTAVKPQRLSSSWFDSTHVKWRWVEKATKENVYAFFECGLAAIREALQSELCRRTGYERTIVQREQLVEHCMLAAFNNMVEGRSSSLEAALETALAFVEPDVAA